MKLTKLTIGMIVATAIALCGCYDRGVDGSENRAEKKPCTDPVVTQIYIQPLNTYSVADAEAINAKLAQVTDKIGRPVEAEILPVVKLGDEFKNEGGTRYRADKILDWLKKGPKPVIALINDDISCTYKDRDDWGVLGLSYLGKDVCVVSSYRVKDKRDFWKVVYHEFGHAYYGLPHCPADDPTCIMQDAKGHPRFGPKNVICDSCWRNPTRHSK